MADFPTVDEAAWPDRQRRHPDPREDSYIILRRLDAFYRRFAATVPPGSRVLDYGCGRKPYFPYFGHVREYLGADLHAGPEVECVLDRDDLVPFPDASFDAVVCSQTLEHARDPWAVVRELQRVLKPGGLIAVSAPFCFRYHADPDDFWRFTHRGLELLFKDFKEVVIEPNASYGETLATLFAHRLSLYTAEHRWFERPRQLLTFAANMLVLTFCRPTGKHPAYVTSDFMLTARKPLEGC